MFLWVSFLRVNVSFSVSYFFSAEILVFLCLGIVLSLSLL